MPNTPLRPLVDFINHGILPFTGRLDEADRVVARWGSGADAHGLGAMLLLGEAGIGKSRLVEEVTARIARLGGAVIHAKLYPESPTAIVPLLARAIARFAAANALLKVEPGESLASVLAALRRLARLRRTLIIIEDVHLLGTDGLSVVMELLNGLADEQVMLLCAARPIELPIRSVLERYLVEEIELEGLNRAELALLLREVLEIDAGAELLDPLLAATAGNPLAVRSALRGAIKSGALARDGRTWRIGVDAAAFQDRLVRNVSLLSEGMAAHLSESERRAAEQIACIGEVVARETVAAMIGDDEPLLEALTFKGIIVSSASPVPALQGPSSAQALHTFTHSLLHRRFVENAAIDPNTILRLVASGAPLYSIVPFQLLDGRASQLTEPTATIAAAFDRTLRVAQLLDSTADWHMALSVWEIGAQLFAAVAPALPDDERRELQVQLLNRRLMLLRREDTGQEYEALVAQLLEVTAEPRTPQAAERRIQALTHAFRRLVRVEHTARFDDIWAESMSLCAAFPELRFALVYCEYLRDVAHAANMMSDHAVQRIIESRLNELIADPEATPALRVLLEGLVYPHLLRTFRTREELERRTAILRELELTRQADDIEFLWQACLFETTIGDLERAMRRFEITMPKMKERGLLYSYSNAMLQRLFCRAATGLPLDAMLAEAIEIRPDAPEAVARNFRLLCGDRLSIAGALRGEPAWTEQILERFLSGERHRQAPIIRLGIALAGDAADAELITIAGSSDDPLSTLIRTIFAAGADAAGLADAFREELARPLLRVDEVLAVRGRIDLVRRADRVHGWTLATVLRQEIRSALAAMLAWLEQRRMHAYITPILDRYGDFLTRQESSASRTRVADMARAADFSAARSDSAGSRLRLTMLGSIAIRRPGEDQLRPRGARLRTLLGLLVADRMLENPLGHREFCRLAASDAAEIEDARKTLNLAVHRLREMIGHDAIITDGETPRLDLELVSVDLLDAHRSLLEAETAIRDAAYSRAVAPLVEALSIAAGEIPFPSLYDEFFEAAREDFENRLRMAAIKTAKGLLHDGDAMSAETILRRAFEAMPDDEELADLLCVALVQLGKRIEAQRVRLQMASAMES